MLLYSVLGSVLLVWYIHREFANQRLFRYDNYVLGAIPFLMIPLAGFSPVILLHFLFALTGSILWTKKGWPAASLRIYLILAAAPGYGIASYYAAIQVIEQIRLRGQYPFESMGERLPVAKKSEPAKLSEASSNNLDQLQTKLFRQGDYGRDYALRNLHEYSVTTFIESPGFGVTRMGRSTDWSTLGAERDVPAVSQPGMPFQSTLGENDFATKPNDIDPLALRDLHLAGMLDFVNLRGLGQFESRKKVLGFRPHRFSKAPESERLKIQAVELVSLLLHPDPVVYVSDKLPNMKDVRKGPTRPLNAFEAAGLKMLRGGDDLFIRETAEGMRMLGAVRAVER